MTINWEDYIHNVNVAEDKGEGEKLEPLEELPEEDGDGTVTVTVKSEEVEEGEEVEEVEEVEEEV